MGECDKFLSFHIHESLETFAKSKLWCAWGNHLSNVAWTLCLRTHTWILKGWKQRSAPGSRSSWLVACVQLFLPFFHYKWKHVCWPPGLALLFHSSPVWPKRTSRYKRSKRGLCWVAGLDAAASYFAFLRLWKSSTRTTCVSAETFLTSWEIQEPHSCTRPLPLRHTCSLHISTHLLGHTPPLRFTYLFSKIVWWMHQGLNARLLVLSLTTGNNLWPHLEPVSLVASTVVLSTLLGICDVTF